MYGCDENGENIYPIIICERRDHKAINPLLLTNGDKYHYVLIQNLNRLLGSGKDHPKEFCPYCCYGFVKKYIKPGQMKEHIETCFTYGGRKVIMPEKGEDTIEFTQYNNCLLYTSPSPRDRQKSRMPSSA